MNLFRVFSRPD